MFKQYKPAILFLLRYITVYLVLNTIYAIYIESNRPDSDAITRLVTKHSTAILHAFDDEVTCTIQPASIHVPIKKANETVIQVFEGCNSINVLIVFIAFIAAFKGPLNGSVRFLLLGGIIIYAVNLLRIVALYIVALKFPDALYFFHKFLFTGIIYFIVFGMWYYWTVKMKSWQTRQPQHSG